MEFLTTVISRLSITGIPIGLQLPGQLVKPHPLKSQRVIPGNNTLATRWQSNVLVNPSASSILASAKLG